MLHNESFKFPPCYTAELHIVNIDGNLGSFPNKIYYNDSFLYQAAVWSDIKCSWFEDHISDARTFTSRVTENGSE